MTDSQKSLRAIFDEASEIATGEPRRAYLDQVCGGDAALRANVEELLQSQETASGFLADPKRNASPAISQVTEREGDRIGRYKLLQKIGEGGCGVVYMAEQTEPVRRRVALKVIKLGMDTRSVIARFEAERQALAMMDHPNIARILDAGVTEGRARHSVRAGAEFSDDGAQGTDAPYLSPGRPYFVMELVRGIKITDYCEQNHLSTPARLQLFIQVCQAVQHAHQKGIIHRDLKPSNILVTSDDGVPLPKVIDFGIAKATADIQLTDKTLFTRFEMFIGTPAYMSPEQAEFNASDIDTRTDIYALGVLLYELLTGQTPFDGNELMSQGIDAMRRTIREKEPPKPSTRLTKELVAADTDQRKSIQGLAVPTQEELQAHERRRQRLKEQIALLCGDLDWIVLQAIEKDRTRRYETANALAMDIQRYLANEPVIARPPSMGYRFGKLVRRNKLAFAAAALVFLAFVLGMSAVIFVQHRANQDYRQRLYVSEVNRAGLAWQAGQEAASRALLDRCPAGLRGWEWNFLHQQLDRWEQKIVITTTNVFDAELSADRRVLALNGGGVVRIHDYPGGQWRRDIPFTPAWQSPARLSPGGEFLATLNGNTGVAILWNLRTGEQALRLEHGGSAGSLAWGNSGKLLLTGGADRTVRVWNVVTGREERHFAVDSRVIGLAVAPDGQTIAVGTSSTNILLLDATIGTVKRTLRSQGPFNDWLKFSPDGKQLVVGNATAGGYLSDKRVWSLEDGGSLDLRSGAEAIDYSFSDDSRRLALADTTGTVQIWDLERRAEVERFSAHVGWGTFVHCLPDGDILSGGSDGRLKRWHARRESVVQLKGYPSSLRTLAFSPDGRMLAAAGPGREVFIWDARAGLLDGIYEGHLKGAPAVAASRDGHVASADFGRTVKLWDPVSRETKWETSLAPAESAFWIAFSPDGRKLYAPSMRDTLTVLDAATGQRLNSISGLEHILDGIAVSPDGRWIVLCQKTKISVRSAEDLRELWSVPALPERCAAISPDGEWIATGDTDGAVSLFEAASAGRVRRTLRGHAAVVKGVAFHPDGSRLISCSADGRVKVWDWRAGVELLTLTVPGGGMLWHAVFSPDGKTIAAADGDGIVTLWKVE